MMQLAFDMVKTSGYIGVAILAMFLVYKTTIVGMITLAIYKSWRLIVTSMQSKNLAARLAAEIGAKTPLTSDEETKILEAVRKYCRKKR